MRSALTHSAIQYAQRGFDKVRGRTWYCHILVGALRHALRSHTQRDMHTAISGDLTLLNSRRQNLGGRWFSDSSRRGARPRVHLGTVGVPVWSRVTHTEYAHASGPVLGPALGIVQ
jgi:hypothetical protein